MNASLERKRKEIRGNCHADASSLFGQYLADAKVIFTRHYIFTSRAWLVAVSNFFYSLVRSTIGSSVTVTHTDLGSLLIGKILGVGDSRRLAQRQRALLLSLEITAYAHM